jgi:transposase-like protein
MRRDRKTWKKLVAEYRASGLSAEAFAARRGLNVGTLRWWCRQLRDEVSSVRPVPMRFVPVKPKASVPPSPGLLELQVGAISLRFETGTDVDYVASLLKRIGGAC